MKTHLPRLSLLAAIAAIFATLLLLTGCVTPGSAQGAGGVGTRQAGVATQTKADSIEGNTFNFAGPVYMNGGSLASIGGQSSTITDVRQEAEKSLQGSASAAVGPASRSDAGDNQQPASPPKVQDAPPVAEQPTATTALAVELQEARDRANAEREARIAAEAALAEARAAIPNPPEPAPAPPVGEDAQPEE